MSALPAAPPTNDREHLKILAIFHYIVGGFIAAIFAVNAFLAIKMWRMAKNDFPAPGHEGFEMTSALYVVPATQCLVFAIVAVCLLVAARLLQRRHGYRFIFFIACLECLGFPFGTVLGAFTLIVLLRPSVKELFGGNVKV